MDKAASGMQPAQAASAENRRRVLEHGTLQVFSVPDGFDFGHVDDNQTAGCANHNGQAPHESCKPLRVGHRRYRDANKRKQHHLIHPRKNVLCLSIVLRVDTHFIGQPAAPDQHGNLCAPKQEEEDPSVLAPSLLDFNRCAIGRFAFIRQVVGRHGRSQHEEEKVQCKEEAFADEACSQRREDALARVLALVESLPAVIQSRDDRRDGHRKGDVEDSRRNTAGWVSLPANGEEGADVEQQATQHAEPRKARLTLTTYFVVAIDHKPDGKGDAYDGPDARKGCCSLPHVTVLRHIGTVCRGIRRVVTVAGDSFSKCEKGRRRRTSEIGEILQLAVGRRQGLVRGDVDQVEIAARVRRDALVQRTGHTHEKRAEDQRPRHPVEEDARDLSHDILISGRICPGGDGRVRRERIKQNRIVQPRCVG
eukprot:scaffold394_cov237-Pinguiococcus_pyrenoidosus.AAC.3